MLNPFVNYKNVVVVAKSGGQFTSIQDAIDSITDATTDNRYVIRIGPGVYEENVVLGSWITLIGMGTGQESIIRAASGITLTLPPNDSFIYFMGVESTPTASGAVCIDGSSGGTHDLFVCFVKMTSATNGITGNLFDVGSTSDVTISDSLMEYTMTGSAVGSNTHNVIDHNGSSNFRALRSDLVTTVADVDDDVNNILANSTGETVTAQLDNRILITNAAYSGTAVGIHHTKTGSLMLDVYSGFTFIGAGSGDCAAIKVDSDTNDAVVTMAYNLINVLGFVNNYHVDAATGDTVNSEYDSIVAAGGTTGAGTVNFFGTFATGQGLITGGALFAIDTVNEWHALSTLTRDANTESNTSVINGTSGAITVFADAGGGQVTVTSTGHSLSENDYITITGTTNYNGVFQATNVLTNTFEITDTWVANDAAGTFHRGTSITVFQRGIYRLAWAFSGESAGANKFFDFAAFNGVTEITGTKLQRKFAGGGDVGVISAGPLIFAEKDDVIWFGTRNITDATDITLSEGSLNTNKAS